jgi:hypothetical protein
MKQWLFHKPYVFVELLDGLPGKYNRLPSHSWRATNATENSLRVHNTLAFCFGENP